MLLAPRQLSPCAISHHAAGLSAGLHRYATSAKDIDAIVLIELACRGHRFDYHFVISLLLSLEVESARQWPAAMARSA